ncbi:MAG: peptidase M14 [Chloracidobacterium sp.]|nr:peptidase M14 [Chloracidobacterium sp.]
MNAKSQTPEQFAADWEKDHVSKLFPSDVRHSDLKKYLEQLKKLGLAVNEVGRSNANREIYQVEWGTGPLKVFMWSQMHGDEPTATSALIDMFAFLQKNRGREHIKKIGEMMTLRAVPMLNPDGADAFQRRNMQGIDINRDALDLKTPEARLLKQLRDDWMPAIGFNLHNQGRLTTVGRSTNQAAISFLVVYGDAAKTTNFGQERNQRLASAMVAELRKFIPGHIARYSDEWTPNAFGDNFSAWGTPTILIETGGLYGKDELHLVKMNFVAFMTALAALATGSESRQDPSIYSSLPDNTSGSLYDFIFRRANIVDRSSEQITPFTDIAVNTERRRASFAAPNFIRIIGKLSTLRGLEEYDASGFNVVQRLGNLKVGELGEFFFYRKDRVVDWTVADLEKQFPPDAIFSGGKWIKGEIAVSKR